MLETSLNEINTNEICHFQNTKEFSNIEDKLETEKDNFEGLAEIYQEPKDIFACFKYFNVEETKVVILGQDPYHQPGQAQGLSFSVPNNFKIPPSLVNIFKEINIEYGEYPKSGI